MSVRSSVLYYCYHIIIGNVCMFYVHSGQYLIDWIIAHAAGTVWVQITFMVLTLLRQ